MPHDRFFLDSPLAEGLKVTLQEEEARHLSKVMRVKVGECIDLVNGQNVLAHAQVIAQNKREALLEIKHVTHKSPPFPLILCQAIPRINRLDFIIEKGTELGATEFWLFPGELSEKKELSASSLERLKLISIAALKQSGRLDLPHILMKAPLSQWQHLPYPSYYGDVDEKAPLFLDKWQKSSGACFFIGPEAGFTEKEEALLKKLGAFGVRLHANILRTETASIVALSLMQHWILDSMNPR